MLVTSVTPDQIQTNAIYFYLYVLVLNWLHDHFEFELLTALSSGHVNWVLGWSLWVWTIGALSSRDVD